MYLDFKIIPLILTIVYSALTTGMIISTNSFWGIMLTGLALLSSFLFVLSSIFCKTIWGDKELLCEISKLVDPNQAKLSWEPILLFLTRALGCAALFLFDFKEIGFVLLVDTIANAIFLTQFESLMKKVKEIS